MKTEKTATRKPHVYHIWQGDGTRRWICASWDASVECWRESAAVSYAEAHAYRRASCAEGKEAGHDKTES